MMGTLLFLATEAIASQEEGGFGLNLDILETNVINLAILVGVLVVFGRKFLANTLNERRANIEATIKEAEQRLAEATAKLAEAQKSVKESEQEAQRILRAAEDIAKDAREAILAKAAVDVQRMKDVAAADLNTEQEKAIAYVRSQVVAKALAKVEAELQSGVSDETQQKLIDSSIALLGGR
ncbi:ATP synthase F0 subunit B [Calothrix sp. NIES-3974]|nr:ATP synthase F0 subunit B [Calothrix sp. NIES-3974]